MPDRDPDDLPMVDNRTIGGDFLDAPLDEGGKPTGWKLRGMNERLVMARMEARRAAALEQAKDVSVLAVRCPHCGASPRSGCFGPRGYGRPPHAARHRHARAVAALRSTTPQRKQTS